VGSIARMRGEWWRSAVIYQIYPRSFADRNGDGVGDLAGIRYRLRYLADLGVDAVWISPWYPSPMKDAGYDVSDYRDIDPVFGTLPEGEALITEAHELGLRVLLDIVPNHTSDQHRWFQEALAAGPWSPERDRYLFRDGRGPDGDQPPNDWISQFGGTAWSRVIEPDGRPGQWYLRLYAPEQPDLNWQNPEVRAEFEAILRFWFDRGVDGFRVDVAHGLAKADGLPDRGDAPWPLPPLRPDEAPVEADMHPHWDRAAVHEIYRSWRRVADSYPDPRVFVAEAWVNRPHRLARYVRPDELHTAFNFDFLNTPWRAELLRRTIDHTVAALRRVGAPPTWVLSNHDVVRPVSRLARPQPDHTGRLWLEDLLPLDADFGLGVRRARAAALLMLALPGGAYVYQGEELGLPEVEDLPDDARQDPVFEQTGRARRGRDGSRVPLPWSGDRPPYGFSPNGAGQPWLPQPATWTDVTVVAQERDPASVLNLYRRALQIRRGLPALGDGGMQWLASPDGSLVFARDPDFVCMVNVSADPIDMPEGSTVIIRSGTLTVDGRIPADTTVWLERGRG
jgi:alpha-glucosidase